MRNDPEAKMDALPDGLCIVFVLCALEGFSAAEAAVALEIPEALVRTRLAGARRELREVVLDDVFAFNGERLRPDRGASPRKDRLGNVNTPVMHPMCAYPTTQRKTT